MHERNKWRVTGMAVMSQRGGRCVGEVWMGSSIATVTEFEMTMCKPWSSFTRHSSCFSALGGVQNVGLVLSH